MQIALITGITGQDGSFLTELLLGKGYEVHGIIRRTSISNTNRIDHLIHNKSLVLHCGDLLDPNYITSLIKEVQPDEVYNLAAQSDVRVSFDQPSLTTQVNSMGALNILEAIRHNSIHSKFYQASTSEMLGGVSPPITGYDERSGFQPRNPYAVAKLYAYWMTRLYRESYGIFSCNGILFNHESSRRGIGFVTKKITNWCQKFQEGERDILELGNLNALRDWGHAKDYVEAMYLMMQASSPNDWIVASGESHTVREFVEKCLNCINKTIVWEGHGLDEVGKVDGEIVIKINPQYFRPSEVNILLGDSSKIRKELGWNPKFNFSKLVEEMMGL